MIFQTGMTAYADAIAEPNDNGFYRKNYESVENIDWRQFMLMEDCSVYDNPIERNTVSELEKGDIISANHSYTADDGSVWVSYLYDEENYTYGWVPTENARLVYDHFSFVEEHENELDDYSGELDGYQPEEQVIIWKYPRSAEYSEVWDKETWNNWFYGGSVFSVGDLARYSWTDENGDKWIYFSYMPDGWVYLPEPESGDIDRLPDIVVMNDASDISAETPASENYSAVEYGAVLDTLPEQGQSGGDMKLPIILACICAAVSAGIIIAVKKR